MNAQNIEPKTFAIADSPVESDIVYQMVFSVTELTPYICSLSNLESGQHDFSEINKR
jgi:hypothetical protein